jgi:hypothetical protein
MAASLHEEGIAGAAGGHRFPHPFTLVTRAKGVGVMNSNMRSMSRVRSVVSVLGSAALVGAMATLFSAGPADATVHAGRAARAAAPQAQPQAPRVAQYKSPGGTRPAELPATLAAPDIRSFATVHQTFVVDNPGDATEPATACAAGNATTCTLRAAVTAANRDTGKLDGISVPAGMTIALTQGPIDLTNSVLIDGTGATVSGGGTSIFGETAPVSVQITGLTMTDGGGSDEGGAISLYLGALVLTHVTVTHSTSDEYGGGLFEGADADLWVIDSTFSANSVVDVDEPEDSFGGGLYTEGAADITGSTIGGSAAADGNTAYEGAGIYNEGTLTVSDSTVDDNYGPADSYAWGVGIYNDGSVDVSGSSVSDNSATGGGGGTGMDNDYVATISDTSFDGNSTTGHDPDENESGGAGLVTFGATDTLTDVTFIGNTESGNSLPTGTAVYTSARQFTWNGGTVSGTVTQATPTTDDAAIEGGDFFLLGNASISDVTVSDTTNEAGPDGRVDGGVVFAASGECCGIRTDARPDDCCPVVRENSPVRSGAASLDSVTITGTTNGARGIYGGAIDNIGGFSLDDVAVNRTTDDAAGATVGYVYGGVIYADGGLTVTGLTSTDTTVTASFTTSVTVTPDDEDYVYGGALYTDDGFTATDMSFSGATVHASHDYGYVYGGAWYDDDAAQVHDSQFLGFTVATTDYTYGGLLYDNSYLDATSLTLGNSTVAVGGGLKDESTPYGTGTLVYSDNRSSFTNTTIDNDTTTVTGTTGNWGVEVAGSTTEFVNSTIANDTVTGTTKAGGTSLLGVGSFDDYATISLLNSIVASTTPAENCWVTPGTGGAAILSVDNNIDSGSSCGFTGPGDLENTNPMVANLADNGGQVETGALETGSPAIDAGTNTGCPATDARGVPRPQGPLCDIGAYEVAVANQGYWMVGSDGGVFNFGDAGYFGSMGGISLNEPIVGMAATPDRKGYWEVAADGGIFSFGDAGYYQSMAGRTYDAPFVGMAATPDGKGYWEVGLDGGVFAFGDAQFYGSLGGIHLAQPIVGIAPTPDGGGYWLVAKDGGVFAFGDAQFYGSGPAIGLGVDDIVGMAVSDDGGGYWLVGADGGVYTFGDAPFDGSVPSVKEPLEGPVVGMAATSDGGGYWLFGANGGVYAFPDAKFDGSLPGITVKASDIVGGAA